MEHHRILHLQNLHSQNFLRSRLCRDSQLFLKKNKYQKNLVADYIQGIQRNFLQSLN